MEKNKLDNKIVTVFWIFILGSITGYIYEMILVLFQKGYFESRQGLIYGPFIPVYGIGAVIYYIALNNVKIKNKLKIFYITMILGGITEYLCSYIQETVFGTISWDYSYLPFNLNGRTSLLHCMYWGIGGILFITYVLPIVKKIGERANIKSLRNLTSILICFMFFNITISFMSASRQSERKMNIPPQSKIDVMMDKYYPDEYMDKIFANKKEVNT